MKDDELLKEFALRLGRLCDLKGLPKEPPRRQLALGKLFGVSYQAARKWLEAEGFPSTKLGVAISAWGSVGFDWLMTGRGEGPVLPAYQPPSETIVRNIDLDQPPTLYHRALDPASIEDPFARIEAALADLLILDGQKDAVMNLIRERATESAAVLKAFMERREANRRRIEKGPPEDTPERRGSGFATFEGYAVHGTPAHYKAGRKGYKK